MTRTVWGILYAAIMLAALYFGSGVFALLCSCCAAFIMFECCRMFESKGIVLPLPVTVAGVLASTLCCGLQPLFFPVVLLTYFCVLILFSVKGRLQLTDALLSLGMTAYLSVGMGCLLALRTLDVGYAALLAFVVVWSTDVGAYLIGSMFGKHKLLPSVSPQKSWEGALGGLIICVLAVGTYNYFCLGRSLWFVLLAGVMGSLMGQFGDLLESFLKRNFGTKDSGRLIPGHGGLFDRLDSMMLAAPFIYAVFLLFGS